MAYLEKVEAKDKWPIDIAYEKAREIQSIVKLRGRRWYDWPFEMIDKLTQWIIEGKVYTIWAYSNTWKSQLAYWYASYFLLLNKKVMFISTEVGVWDLLLYIIRNLSGENYHDILRWEHMIDKDELSWFLPFDNIFDIEQVEEAVKLYKPDVVFIDFIQSIRAPGGWEYEKMSYLATQVQKIAIENNVTIFSLSQVNNSSKGTSDITLKWSWGLFASSDYVFWLYYENGERKLKIMKNKTWPVNKVFVFDIDFNTWQVSMMEDLFSNDEFL